MAKTQYLEYTIHLTDKAQAVELQAAYPGGIKVAPTAAALAYLAPVQIVSELFAPPCTRSPLFIHPVVLPSSLTNYPRHLDTFDRKSGGWFGISSLFGQTTTFIWVGKFAYASDATATVDGEPAEVVPIATRKFFVGFEVADSGGNLHAESMNSGSNSQRCSRDASRHADGFGWLSNSNGEYAASPTQSGDAGNAQAWERFYVRMITAPNKTTRMWRITGSAGAGTGGVSINMTIDRRLVVHNITSGTGVETALATSSQQLELDRWYRIDVLAEFAAAGGSIVVYLNRAAEVSAVGIGGVGLMTASTHNMSYLGPGANGLTTDQFQCHYDDWICSEFPHEDSDGDYVGLDWLNGSRVRLIPATAFGAGNNFTGDYRYANQATGVIGVDTAAKLESAVSGDALRLVMDEQAITTTPGAIGVVAFLVAVYGRNQVAGQGTLGWKFDGVIDLAAQITHSGGTIEGGNTLAWFRRWHRPSGAFEPIANLTPIELHKVKAADTNLAEYYGAMLTVELIGVFGDEDIGEDEAEQPEALPARRGVHNAPYPMTTWARASIAPISPVITHTGTYVGNATAQELTFRAPVGWLMIKRVGSTSTGGFWWSSMFGGHQEGTEGVATGMPVQALIDPAFVPVDAEDQQEQRTVIRITGNDAQFNGSGVTYQYVAFMDPGSRYHLNGVYYALASAFTPVGAKAVALVHETFLPEYGFYHKESPGGSPGGTYVRAIKGPGHAADAASVMNAAETASAMRHDAGMITVLPGLMEDIATRVTPYSLWRDDDQSSDPGKDSVVKVGSYVGDGAASRTINFATSGRRPVYVIVSPHNATPSHHRDPSNLTNTSAAMGTGASTTTGITAGGIDSFTVGITLNATGITHEYFVLIGGTEECEGGWSCDGEFAIVEPDSPADGPYGPPPSEPGEPEPEPDPDPDPGPGDEDDCESGEVCIAATTRQVNLALLELGVSQTLTNYCTQQTTEAKIARLLYETSVRSTLVMTPWPFATRYAALVLTAAQPANADWTYSYRVPVDCVFPRRLVVSRGTGVDPEPPAFMLSSDASGGLLFSNQPAAVLEYTCRPNCVAFNGDDLFLEALKWHLAAALAPPLTRMTAEAERCTKMFELTIEKANAIRKPGVPGLRTAANPMSPDAAAACITANIQVVNRGLLRIGCQTIANLSTDQSRPAVAANLILEDELRATLQDYPWKFAKRYNPALTLVGGTASVSANADWQYSYRLPDDYVMVRRLVAEGIGRKHEDSPPPWEVGTDATGNLLFTDVALADLNLEYTARIPCAVAKASDLFRDALAWRIAAALAPSLAQVDPTHPEQLGRGPDAPTDPRQRISHKPNLAQQRAQATRYAQAMYQQVLVRARIQDANEAEPEDDVDAEWIRDRG